MEQREVNPYRLLICSADDSFVDMVHETAPDPPSNIAVAEDFPAVLRFVDPERWQLLVVDGDLTDPRWNDWLPLLRPEDNRLIAIMITASRDAEHTMAATRHGYWEYLLKPVDRGRFRRILADARIVVEQTDLGEGGSLGRFGIGGRSPAGQDRLIGQSPAMQEVFKRIGMVAGLDVDVLVTGESGTGKELVCRALHEHSKRKDGPFIAINCAAVPETLLESELFGHEKGAFTGADARRIGRFEQAEGGTMLLDEIGDMSPNLQAKLLRLIQDRTFYRVGGNELITCDTRVIAATHQDLERRIDEGLFRQDLYYRLSVVAVHLPPLREREVDVVLVAHHIMATLNRELGRHVRSFHPRTVRGLLRYDWPGNVRELQNVIKQAMMAAHGSVLLPSFLPEHVRRLTETPEPGEEAEAMEASARALDQLLAAEAPEDLSDERLVERMALRYLGERETEAMAVAVRAIEREMIRQSIEAHGGNYSAAARHLGVTRLTLRRKIEAYGLRRSTFVRDADDET
jgi:DNA-binding NtrC family response regulator